MPTVHLRDALPSSGHFVIKKGRFWQACSADWHLGCSCSCLKHECVWTRGEAGSGAVRRGEAGSGVVRKGAMGRAGQHTWQSFSLQLNQQTEEELLPLGQIHLGEFVQHRVHSSIGALRAAVASVFGTPGVPAVCSSSHSVTACCLTPLTDWAEASDTTYCMFFIGSLFYVMFVSRSLTSVVFMFNAVLVPVVAVF